MFRRHYIPSTVTAILLVAAPGGAEASFHRMQVQQIIGGVLGDTSAQAVQLRMRAPGQNFVSDARLRVWDAAGANPIVVIDIPTDVSTGNQGSKVLIASASFLDTTNPEAVPDFTMTNLIPPSYLPAGSLTFESTGAILPGTVYWRLSWGGANYTGDTTGHTLNDADGDFGPP